MSASSEELIAINSLLIEREAAFARVHTLESRINELLGAGEPYPFESPTVNLPSHNRKKATKTKKAKAQNQPLKPRRLNENEAAYRLTWMDQGNETQQSATDLKNITTLLNENLPGLKLLKIETVDLSGEPLERLFPE